MALPLSGEELHAQLEAERPSDFAREIRARFSRTAFDRVCRSYADEVALAEPVLSHVRSAGVTVVERASLADVARLTDRFHVVSIMAHTPGSASVSDASPVLELADGLHMLGAVRGAISRGFDGVLDLAGCTTVGLAEALKRVRHDFLVVSTVQPTHPRLRFLRIEQIVRELALAGRPVLFTHAVRVVADALAIAARRRR